MKKVINTEKAPQAIGPYSQAILANGMLFISGQIPINPETGEIAEGIENQTRQVLNNLKAILEKEHLTLDNVVKCSVFMKNMDDFVKMNEVYAEFFTEEPPARAAVEVARLPKDVEVEIEAIAINRA